MTINITELQKKWLKNGGIITGILMVLTSFYISLSQDKRTGYQDMLERHIQNIERLEDKIEKLEADNVYLRTQVSILGSVTYEMPIPMWVKGLDGKMINLNKSYEDLFLIPNGKGKLDYIGKTDVEFWGSLGQQDLGRRYRAHDIDVATTRTVKRYIEYASIDSQRVKFIVYKFPFWTNSPNWNGKKVMGTGGIAVPAECD